MFWLIENNQQLQNFINIGYEEAFIEIIPTCHKTHPVKNQISLIYVKPTNSKGLMLSLNHSEAFKLDLNEVLEAICKIKKVWVRDIKEFVHYLPHPNLLPIYPPNVEPTKTHEFYYRKHYKLKNLNYIIPISKHYEYCEEIVKNIKYNTHNPQFVKKTNLVFSYIEKAGIKINRDIFNEYYEDTEDEFVYTQYNLNTTTTRPSNAFNKINFSALSKDNGERKAYIPRNDYFLDIDISAYHPTLLAKLIKYDFPKGDIHQAFAEMYGVDYKQAKELTFKQLYGGIFEQYKDLEFFRLTQEYVDGLWKLFNLQGYIECPISKHIFYRDKLGDMNPQKLLNYLLQSLETSNNVVILYKILKLLNGKNTKLVLYVYDSFLLDVDENEIEVVDKIKEIFSEHKLNIKTKTGINYNELS